MDIEKWYEENGNKKITITLTYEEWRNIAREANGHLSYWGYESESVEKLDDVLDEFEKETGRE